ncbi:hypothetical protein SCL_0650 [Sulfuricaulis limicola]|uniref:Uncharacterized protein n=1 Tax=Sulfuricaulis limicola TaxID=1620215 RepID=A0A1B4XDV5_9GAMM|nr:hypothetical protein [Sulfuricaulis limicola]BAV32972.1 hypothetical protein SCL_0650 [Sulfuricaulis limicola]
MPFKTWIVGVTLALPLAVAAADKPETADMELIEFLGSLETKGDSGKEVLSAIDTGLLPDLPEEPPYDEAK